MAFDAGRTWPARQRANSSERRAAPPEHSASGGDARTRRQLLAAVLAWGALLPLRADVRQGPDAPLTQYQVQAAFLYHFAKYVTWPPHAFPRPDEPLVIGVLGEDPFGDDLARAVAREKSVQARSLKIVRTQNIAEALRCHILFISASEGGRLAQHFAALRRANSAALTVGESDEFLNAGGAVRFVVEQNKVRFDINAANAERAGLAISSKLLSLARNARSRG